MFQLEELGKPGLADDGVTKGALKVRIQGTLPNIYIDTKAW